MHEVDHLGLDRPAGSYTELNKRMSDRHRGFPVVLLLTERVPRRAVLWRFFIPAIK